MFVVQRTNWKLESIPRDGAELTLKDDKEFSRGIRVELWYSTIRTELGAQDLHAFYAALQPWRRACTREIWTISQ
jgi:hypothetical protein